MRFSEIIMTIVTNTTRNTLVNEFPVSVHNPTLNHKLEVFPNPTQGDVKAICLNLDETCFDNCVILNAQGKEIMESKNCEFDLSALSNGMYIIKINRGSESFAKKIIKI